MMGQEFRKVQAGPDMLRDGEAVSISPTGLAVPLQRHSEDGLCLRSECRKPLRGRQTAFCSDHCRWLAWDAEHPRLNAGWTPTQRQLSLHLDKRESRKARMLARLREGEATTWELMQIGGSGWRSRLHELSVEGHPYTCENRLDYAVYRLVL